MDFNTISLLLKHAKGYGHAKIREAGVSDTEHKICTFLYFHSDAYQDMIADSLMLDKTTVAKAIQSLEERGLIKRVQNPHNRRRNILNITDAGKETILDVVGIYDEWLEKIESCLTEAEREQFHDFCARLLEKAKEIGGN
ncbi:MAG: winged helix-turn-helix transcriptional regulator [Clostridiales bacterium]|jgi:DNA-binding MarR family transcriptional regulator|nr:winged helix-turn-helix transcriptional regulator [Clostridiales bacterium]